MELNITCWWTVQKLLTHSFYWTRT